jgi:hypothetical protein
LYFKKLALVAIISLSQTAYATNVGIQTADCPLTEGVMRTFVKLSANHTGGWDSDFAEYSGGGQWREYAISTCPYDGFTLYGEDIAPIQDEALANRLRERLEEHLADLPPIDEMPVWERYLVAAEMYKVMDKDPLFMAHLYMQAAWTARDTAVGVFHGLEGPIHARELITQGEGELETQEDPSLRKILLHNLARIAHRGGYTNDRNRFLSNFEEAGSLSSEEAQALATFRSVSENIEPRLLALAAEQMQRHLSSTAEASATSMGAWCNYIIADIARRGGDNSLARHHYQLVLGSNGATDQMRELAEYLIETL